MFDGLKETNYFFVRIPRTGSTSICKALNFYPNHKTAKVWRELMGDRFDSLFKFTIVRNPIDRFISCYMKFGINTPIDEFIKKGMFKGDIRFLPQTDYIYIDGKLAVDYIGKYEELDKSWFEICSLLKINKTELEHLQTTTSPKPSLSPSLKSLLQKYYSDDFGLL